ncbi:hypothetical protein EW145_g6373 [Phellinidium pouzarii]|uniref:F-box domain-containing protein n=1 Tax=Phellinidium pouzarii TaxID=167371 RepID=A0A4S4KX15_9AGAM|nr:hypothetical protein EW145_g6373 [Phellinidium pouzarii]
MDSNPPQSPSQLPASHVKFHHPYFSPAEVDFLSEKQRGKLSANQERLRQQACGFIEAVGVKIGFPRKTIATAQSLYHRFHLFFPMKDFNYYDVTMACVYVSTKMHDTLKKPRDILMVSYTVRYPELALRSKAIGGEVEIDPATVEQDRQHLLGIERLVLETVCFNFTVHMSFPYVIKIGRALNVSKELTRFAWRLAVDSNRTLASLQYPPHVIALACIYLAALLSSFEQPTTELSSNSKHRSSHGLVAVLGQSGDWEKTFKAAFSFFLEICHHLLDLLIHAAQNPSATTSPSTPSSPSPHAYAPPRTPHLSHSLHAPQQVVLPIPFKHDSLMRLKIYLRETEHPARSRMAAEDVGAGRESVDDVFGKSGDMTDLGKNEGTEKFEDALKSFDKAIQENDQEKSIYDSRAAVLEKLDRPLDALKDCKKVIDLAQNSWQGYARSARLFLQIERPCASLKMADLALERLRRTEKRYMGIALEDVRRQALKEIEQACGRQSCFFSKVPVEICNEIFVLVADQSTAKAFALTLVCRRWREIITNAPSFWRYLVLTPKTKSKKVEMLLRHSKGILYSLQLQKSFSFDARPNILRHASENLWAKLKTLKVDITSHFHESLCQVLPPGAFSQLHLEELEIYISDYSTDFWKPLDDMDTSRMRTLVLDNSSSGSSCPWKQLLRFSTLTTLNIKSCRLDYNDVYPIIVQNPLLETIILRADRYGILSDINEQIELPHLRRLDLCLSYGIEDYLRALRFPALEFLNVERVYGQHLFFLSAQSLCHLKELRFQRCEISFNVIVTILRSTEALEKLAFPYCTPAAAVDRIVEELERPISDSSTMVYCPRLQYLDLSGATELKAYSVVRLVKARLLPTDSSPEGDPEHISPTASPELPQLPLPIRTLRLDDCDALDPTVLPWLRTKVWRVYLTMTREIRGVRMRSHA